MLRLIGFAWLGLLFSATLAFAGELFTRFPDEIRSGDRYVFYMHGASVVGDRTEDVHPIWGAYEFDAIKQALSDPHYNLIAYRRSDYVYEREASERLTGEVGRLLAGGVDPEDIILVGFSMGGVIAILTAAKLNNDRIKLIVLAGCGGMVRWDESIKPPGAIYSILDEEDDFVGSCRFLAERGSTVSSFREITLKTGKGHGAFFSPLQEWVDPVKKWIKQ